VTCKLSKMNLLTVLFLFVSVVLKGAEPSSYEELDVSERRALFSNKNNLPEKDPDKLVMLLTHGINEKDKDVLLEAVKMSVLTISGIESREKAGDPVDLNKAVYNKFLRDFEKLKNHLDPRVQSILKETGIYDEEVFKKLQD